VGLLWASLSFPLQAITPPGSLTLAWNPVPDPDVAGYNLYYGTASRVYTSVVQVEDTAQVTIMGLRPGVTYFLAVTTVSSSGLESDYSDEITFTLPIVVPVLQPLALPAGQVGLAASAPPGHTYDVLATQDFALWLAIGTVTADPSGAFKFTDPDASQYPYRFYQLHETTYTDPGSLPVLDLVIDPGTGLEAQITGQIGHTYEILTTLDFGIWGVVGVVSVGSGGIATTGLPGDPYFPFSFYSLREANYIPPESLAPFTILSVVPGQVQLGFDGGAGHTYNLMETSDFSFWTPRASITFRTDGTAAFVDAFDPADNARVYRIDVAN
jgi:hypothetical protein